MAVTNKRTMDVSENRKTAAAPAVPAEAANLGDREERFRAVFNQQFQFMAILAPDGTVLEVNDLAVTATGVSREEVIGKLFWDTGWWSGLPEMQRAWPVRLAEAAKADGPILSEDEFMRADGTRRLATAAITAVKANGAVRFFIIQATDITDRRQAELSLRESEERFRIMADNLPQIIWVHDAEGQQQFVNQTFCEYFGVSREEMRKSRWQALMHPDEGHAYTKEFAAAVHERRAFHGEVRVQRGDGQWRWLESWAHPRFSPQGEFLGHVGTSLDITERKRTEAALAAHAHQQGALYQLADDLHRSASLEDVFEAALKAVRSALQCSRASILLFDEKGVMRFVAWHGLSENYRKAVEGHSPWQANAKDPQPVIVDDVQASAVSDSLKAIAKREGIHALGFIPVLSDGRLMGKFMAYFDAPHHFAEDELQVCLTIGHQLAFGIDRQRAEQALRESQQRLQQAISIETVGVLFFNLAGQILEANRAFAGMSGFSREELVALTDWKVLTAPEFLEATARAAGELAQSGRTKPYEKQFVRKDGSRWWALCAPRRVRGAGRESECVEFIVDITERKQVENALRESEERFRNMADHAPVIIWVTGADDQCTYLNQRWYDFTGQPPGAGLGFGWFEAVHPDDREPAKNVFLPAKERREPFQVGYRLRQRDGEWRWMMAAATPRFGTDGKFLGHIGSIADIDDQKRLAEKLERTVQERTLALDQTIQQLETFSYSIVHDMRAPLRSMRSFATLLESEQGDKLDPQGHDYLSRIINSATRLDTLITDVLAYSRVSMNQAEQHRVDLDRLLMEILNHYPQFQEAAPHISVARPLPHVLGNAALLTQVFSNLLGNALKFVPPGRQPRILVRAEPHDRRVRLWVEDNGIGIDPQQKERIFGLFQRLHRTDEFAGTGVGLAIVKKAVDRMGGTVGVESVAGQGSRFWFELPAADTTAN